MKISVLIPTYNAAKTIEMSLASVFRQTIQPDEIVVLVDGGTDETVSRLDPLKGRINLVVQENRGVAQARNRLVELAQGEMLAFLDSDDVWHPKYLEVQHGLLQDYPSAVASFTGHIRFHGYGEYECSNVLDEDRDHATLIDRVEFFRCYNTTTAVFGSMSYCCVRRQTFEKIGSNPFSTGLHGVEDSYLCYQLALLGSVVYLPSPLVAYRITEGSLSVNRLRNLGLWVHAFEMLQEPYRRSAPLALAKAFAAGYASKRREYAKVLLGVGKSVEARRQLIRSLGNCWHPPSLCKSLGLLLLSLLPPVLQPQWPSSVRQVGVPPVACGKNGMN
ncbi:MAG: glycosyltransferase family 2 protein [Deltaproteobacteria bacterium]|nr:glycosyltransferase family 2 protein [Deltaproteobacteria bacterium]MBM4321963.1 glycosyltransferase family 2 protein [Deltaproteobacteria bacterium]